jgi:hypothetical protein
MKSEFEWQLQIKKNLFFLCVKVILTSFLGSCSSVCTICFNLTLKFLLLEIVEHQNLNFVLLHCQFHVSYITVINPFNKLSPIAHVLKKYRLETLPGLLGHITFRGADNIANCKLLEKFFRLHIPWEFINELFRLCRQMISLCDNHFSSRLFLRFQGEKCVFHKVAILRSGTLHEVTDM